MVAASSNGGSSDWRRNICVYVPYFYINELIIRKLNIICLIHCMKEGHSNSRPPLLEGMNYLIWKTKMRSFLCSLDDDVWFSILEGYKIPAEVTEQGSIPKSRSKWTVQEKRDSNMNSKALNALFCGVDDLNFRYIQNCKIAKEAWDKLEVAHEGTDGVKRSKLQMLTSQFESIRMEEGEKVADFNSKLIDITNRSCMLGEEYVESKIVRKILRSLPHRFQGKVIAIEESKNVDKIRLEELIGSLETFELGLGEEKKEKNKNIAFKSENNSENNEAIDNEELVFFTRKFKQFLNKNNFSKNFSRPSDKRRNNKFSENIKKNQVECYTCGGKGHISKDCANNKGKSMKATWSDDSDEESEEEETKEENIQAFTTKLEEFEEESIEENDDYEESLEHSYQELFDQGLELIKEKKRLKGNITSLEISNNNLIDIVGNLKEEKQKLSDKGIELKKKLDGAYQELKEKIHELKVEKAEKIELKESLKESQHAVNILTLGAEKVTKMINFGKINDDKKGLGFDENKVCSNSSTIFVKATSSSLNSEIDSQAKKCCSNKESNNSSNVVSRPSKFRNLHHKKNMPKNPQVKNRNQVEKAFCVVDSIDKSDWYFDSGCTKHMTGDIRNFYSLDDFGTGTIVYGNGEISNILGVGQVDITGLPSMDKVCYVDKLAVNLISIGQLCDSGFKVLFDEYYCNIYDSNKKIVGQGYRTARGLYRAKIIEFDICTNESLSDIDESEDDCDRANESQEGNEANEQ
ncbi:hypothetical protein UlMin_045734 [Ulmus minor]